MQYEQIVTEDGYTLAARFFMPEREPIGGLLIAPAMGVGQDFYAAFARWAASRGCLVVTFDYRGVGLSAPATLRGFDADVMDWAESDCQAVLAALAQRVGARPLYWLGHSIGVHLLPFVPGHERLTKVISVASGSGYWRENSPPLKRRVWLLWYLIAPLTMPAFRYFPGKRFGMVGDLPSPAMRRWRRWCLHPEYVVGVEPAARRLFAAVTTPIVSLSFSDDEFMSARNTESLHGFYVNAPRKMRRIAPQEAGVRRIGHFGFFRPEHEVSLWERYVLPELGELPVTEES
ncbi:alpha/beta hydrolase [Alkalilimnicola ehrlichii]|uniref:Alpha/beta hydrolase n=1 Tax=Alkalilimnicola ehrlichii TaxID=351052 RepID=A0A3E0WH15_9GAMM|nr:alpha/beta hydrolase [Alkalilimnicola ehrlichii]RFA25192.1 alpha/beta hydrolase [Alkalilimnicola ehrlichii]RFA32270.1 alpha/beta hydrolase [Alkalilimnicola ehrlichii]